jgi:hypothetical protein
LAVKNIIIIFVLKERKYMSLLTSPQGMFDLMPIAPNKVGGEEG